MPHRKETHSHRLQIDATRTHSYRLETGATHTEGNATVDWDDNPDEEWIVDESDEEDDILACPSCGGEVHEDAQQCPHCGDWIVPVDPRDRSRRLFWVIVTLALILGLAMLTIG